MGQLILHTICKYSWRIKGLNKLLCINEPDL